jgi:AraC-like DNA-binding protein
MEPIQPVEILFRPFGAIGFVEVVRPTYTLVMTGPGTFSVSPRVLEKLGLPIERLCERAGVAPSNAWVTSDFFRIWAVADEELGDRSAGVRFGAEGIARGYGVASIVALHAPDFRHALSALSRYKRLTCPELVEVDIEGDEATVRYRWLQATGEVPRLLVDTTMASLRELARQGTAGQVTPIRLELARRPMDRVLLRRHFECPIVFGAAHDAMVFDRVALDVPFVTADGGAFAHVLEGLEKRIAQGEGFSALVGEVRVAIARQLSEGRRPSIAAVARRLRVSSRTLQRRLDECKTSFQQQLAGVRRTTASRLLANTELDTVAIAMLLGFVEPNSFVRAFRAWERTTPLRWRERQTRVQA